MAATILLSAVLAAPLHAQSAPVLVRVNGKEVTRAMVAERAWQRAADTSLNELVDEILIAQAAASLKVAPDPKEVESRLKRIRGQFPDEATFTQRLKASGATLEAVRAQIADQVLREQLVIKAKGLRVTDPELKEFFDANKDKLGTPESMRVRHILVASEKEANDFLVAVRAGADFARLATQVSIDPATRERGGDLGFISKGMLQPDIEKVVFGLKPGEASGPLKTQMGFHLLKVEEARAPKAAVFKDISAELKQAMLGDKIAKAFPEYLKELRQQAKIEPTQASR